ncbi:sugar phosphate isomerase/epimerase [Parabacteroides sp. AM08-6]|uniref:sugar phosphate isomerase/epimerase family protein n=1 Tax=Parabacteroides sp. AM08-6 TaxID=2292053 RepID=UPI000F00FF9A|nr:sugar phosphate isomerase/epimerase family protein [Parabacteroides sp. AM08-6]RHJ82717.1 sugar phosphate isomerase/epimerase [Parabacteroides sp. AM08-6]
MQNIKISRRKMLISSSLALLGVKLGTAAPAICSTSSPKRMPFRISLNTSTISGYNLPVEQQIEYCAEAGFEGIELWTKDIEAYVEKGGSYRQLAGKLQAAHLILENIIGFSPWIAGGKGMDEMLKEMDMAAALGSRCIAATALGIDQLDRNDFERYSDNYRKILEYGETINVRPLLEVWGSGALNQVADAARIALGTGHPKASMLLDFYHLYRGNNSFDSLHLINGAELPVFHINDYPATPARTELSDADRVYPGDGICPFDKLLPLLYETGFRGALSLELFNPAYWTGKGVKKALETGYKKVSTVIAQAMK